jgi:hypothetical protein
VFQQHKGTLIKKGGSTIKKGGFCISALTILLLYVRNV